MMMQFLEPIKAYMYQQALKNFKSVRHTQSIQVQHPPLKQTQTSDILNSCMVKFPQPPSPTTPVKSGVQMPYLRVIY